MSNSVIDEDGDKVWTNDEGLFHRLDGPAIEYANGDKSWYFEGKLHRLNGPAIEYANGDKSWYFEEKRHRIDGPAVEHADGCIEFWENGIQKFPRYRSIDSEFEVSCE